MLRFFVVMTAMLAFVACGSQVSETDEQEHDHAHHDHDGHDHDHHGHDHHEKGDGVHYGLVEISADGAISASDLVAKLDKKEGLTELTAGESKVQGVAAAKVEGTITEVCQAAGCWFRMKTTDGKEVFIQMKEHKNIPIDWSGKTVVAQGDAFIKETSVAELQHYVDDEIASKKDASKEEIEALKKKKEAIKEPKLKYTLIAEGVVLKS